EPVTTSVHYEAWLILGESDGVISGKLDYTTDYFDHATIERLARHLGRVLEGFVEAPDARIAELDILTNDEKELLSRGWHRSESAYPFDTPIPVLFEAVAARQ